METPNTEEVPKKVTAKVQQFGTPGIPGELKIVPSFPGDQRTDEERIYDGTPREFEVAALISKLPVSGDEFDLTMDVERGGSHIVAKANTKNSLVKTAEGTLELSHNSKRELALIRFNCTTTSCAEASRYFLNVVSGFIDHVSYLFNVPIQIVLVESHDTKNQVKAYNYVGPHYASELAPHAATLHTGMRPIYALYREAKNSQSPFYRFLCYYKILEGIYKHRRPEVFRMAEEKGLVIEGEREIVPDSSDLRNTHPDLIGLRVKDVFDQRFTPEFRDEVAHYLLSDGEVLNVSEAGTAERFGAELLPIELCARVVIAVQEKYEVQLTDQKK